MNRAATSTSKLFRAENDLHLCNRKKKKKKKGEKTYTVMSKDRLPGGQQFSIQTNVCCTNHLCSNCPSCSSGTREAFCQFHTYTSVTFTLVVNTQNQQTIKHFENIFHFLR